MSTEISKVLASGESETVEFKESFHDDALETIGALANAQGGVLLHNWLNRLILGSWLAQSTPIIACE